MEKKRRSRIENRIREHRRRRDITQSGLAQALGVTRVTISCIERGEYYPSLELALKLARFFEAPVEEIFVYQEDNSS